LLNFFTKPIYARAAAFLPLKCFSALLCWFSTGRICSVPWSQNITTVLRKLTCKSRVTVLVLDDSVLRRNRSKAVELLAKVYNHVFHEFVRGFNPLALGWSDGFSFIPVSFVLLSSMTLP